MHQEIYHLAETLGKALVKKGWMLSVAESCTGGGICQALTDVAGSSQWFDRGFITYSNPAKIDMLGVKPETLEKSGAVSAEIAKEMVQGAFERSNANIAVSVTGIAGPGGGSKEKPVGTVFMGVISESNFTYVKKNIFEGSRKEIRNQTIVLGINELLNLIYGIK